uniref:Transthyretin-like family protein n=1 Tax=Heterorhabditis bacteriophora TaxID=37862 RepID=A0A1I7XJX5_HETBA
MCVSLLSALAALFVVVPTFGSNDLDIPSNVANRVDLSQLLDKKQTYITGQFHLEGNTASFPSTQTEIEPYVTFHHNCDMDEKQSANLGYKRWAIRLPEEYVTLGTKPRKVYDFGRINLQIEYPGETHDKKFNFNE